MNKKTIKDLRVSGKKVIVRVDFNVPLQDGKINDDNRIVQALPTLRHLLSEGGRLILLSHLGRVKEETDKAKLTLQPVATRLSELLEQPVTFVAQTRGELVE